MEDVKEEFMKDLLAALVEAEDRIEFLENVLSEQTPSGIEEESGPNYVSEYHIIYYYLFLKCHVIE